MTDYTATREALRQARSQALDAAIAAGRANLSPTMSATDVRQQMLPVLEELQAATDAAQRAYDEITRAANNSLEVIA